MVIPFRLPLPTQRSKPRPSSVGDEAAPPVASGVDCSPKYLLQTPDDAAPSQMCGVPDYANLVLRKTPRFNGGVVEIFTPRDTFYYVGANIDEARPRLAWMDPSLPIGSAPAGFAPIATWGEVKVFAVVGTQYASLPASVRAWLVPLPSTAKPGVFPQGGTPQKQPATTTTTYWPNGKPGKPPTTIAIPGAGGSGPLQTARPGKPGAAQGGSSGAGKGSGSYPGAGQGNSGAGAGSLTQDNAADDGPSAGAVLLGVGLLAAAGYAVYAASGRR